MVVLGWQGEGCRDAGCVVGTGGKSNYNMFSPRIQDPHVVVGVGMGMGMCMEH